jgi:hypothetical protein
MKYQMHNQQIQYRPHSKQYKDLDLSKRNVVVAFIPPTTEEKFQEYIHIHNAGLDNAIFEWAVRYLWLLGHIERTTTAGRTTTVRYKLRDGNHNILDLDPLWGLNTQSAFSHYKNNLMDKSITFFEHLVPNYRVIVIELRTFIFNFFPDFYGSNPFEEPEKYLYPLKNVAIAQLKMVSSMDNCVDVILWLEQNPKTFKEFLSFISNEVLCENEVRGFEKYEIRINSNRLFISNKDRNGIKQRKLEKKLQKVV